MRSRLPWGRRGNRFGGPTDSFDELSDDSIQPVRSMSVGVGDSDGWNRSESRPSTAQRADSEELASTSSRARRPSASGDQLSDPYLVQHSGVHAISSRFRRPAMPGRSMWRRVVVSALAIGGIVVLGLTFAVIADRQNLGQYGSGGGSPDEPSVSRVAPSLPGFPSGAPTEGAPSGGATPAESGTPILDPSATPPPGTEPAQPDRRALYTLRPKVSADGASGQRQAGTLGSQLFRGSTGVHVNCSREPATLTYQLGGEYSRLTTVAGLTGDATPGDLLARVEFSTDGRSRAVVAVSLDRFTPINLNLSGVRTLVVSAQRIRGTCTSDRQPYGLLGNALLEVRG